MDEEELSSEKCRKMSSECLISEKKEENELVFFRAQNKRN